ncbi:MAG: hypothetical protein ACYC61_29375 [Isosphaeraceae bacterium]
MRDDDLTPPQSRRDFQFIRLDNEHHDFRRAALLLEASGGVQVPDTGGALYRFTTAATDEALERVRSRFGWTIASRWDGGQIAT